MRRRKLPSLDFLSAKGNDAAFSESLKRYDPLIKMGVNRFGSKSHSYADNLHHARLALWKTLLWKSTCEKVGHYKFLGKFQKEMKRAVANDSVGEVKRVSIRLDNDLRRWHERVPDKKTSINLHLAVVPRGLRSHYVSDVGRSAVKREARKRRKERLKEKNKLFESKAKVRLEEVFARANVRNNFNVGLVNKVAQTALAKPFLFKPLGLIRVLELIGLNNGKIALVRPRQGDLKQVKILMGRITPENPRTIEKYVVKSLNKIELETVASEIHALNDYYAPDYVFVKKYLAELAAEVKLKKGIPKEIEKDIETLLARFEKKYGSRTSEKEYDYQNEDTPF